MLTLGNKYSFLFLLCIGFVLGFYFCLLFSGCGHTRLPSPGVAVVKPAIIKRQVADVQATYQGRIDSLAAATGKLQTSLRTTRMDLEKAKRQNRVLQTQIYDLLDRSAIAAPDTVSRLTDCDSLQLKVRDLVSNDNSKDSLYEDVQANLQLQISNKDSTIRVQQDQRLALQESFEKSLRQQDTLRFENIDLRKTIRHQKRAGIFRTIGLAVAAALTLHYLNR